MLLDFLKEEVSARLCGKRLQFAVLRRWEKESSSHHPFPLWKCPTNSNAKPTDLQTVADRWCIRAIGWSTLLSESHIAYRIRATRSVCPAVQRSTLRFIGTWTGLAIWSETKDAFRTPWTGSRRSFWLTCRRSHWPLWVPLWSFTWWWMKWT